MTNPRKMNELPIIGSWGLAKILPKFVFDKAAAKNR